jgi:hypothetical protein
MNLLVREVARTPVVLLVPQQFVLRISKSLCLKERKSIIECYFVVDAQN